MLVLRGGRGGMDGRLGLIGDGGEEGGDRHGCGRERDIKVCLAMPS